MKHVDEYREKHIIHALKSKIENITTQEWSIMEICGGQTHAIMKYSLNEFIPEKINLIHGPGCPVCVTPLEKIDQAIYIASQPNVIFVSFGDMMRVPGSDKDLMGLKAEGKDVRMVYSPLDVIKIALENPNKEVVFFAIGFETTSPANALAIEQAFRMKINNLSFLISLVLVPPAIETILSSPRNKIQGFLAAGHVCTIMGYEEYIPLAKKYKIPIVVTGFEPVDILHGILEAIKQLESGRYEVYNQYKRSVKKEGNIPARQLLERVFKTSNMTWRGIGVIPNSGYELQEKYSKLDAQKRFVTSKISVKEPEVCIAGEILQGLKKPYQCTAFGKTCLPEKPLGAPMVSSEGACAAYYKYYNLKTTSA